MCVNNQNQPLESSFTWVNIALNVIAVQRALELESSYDQQASLTALGLIERWVLEHKRCEKQEFLFGLGNWYLERRDTLSNPGDYNGGIGTLGGCVKDIIRANYQDEPLPKLLECVFLARVSTESSIERREPHRQQTFTLPNVEATWLNCLRYYRRFNSWGRAHPYLGFVLIIIVSWGFGFGLKALLN